MNEIPTLEDALIAITYSGTDPIRIGHVDYRSGLDASDHLGQASSEQIAAINDRLLLMDLTLIETNGRYTVAQILTSTEEQYGIAAEVLA